MCSCDYDPPSVFSKVLPTAKKQHRCEECGGAIDPGQIYERVFGVWDGYASTFKTCMHCVELREFMETISDCFCPTYGNLVQEALDEIQESGDIRLLFPVGRRVVLANRRGRQMRLAAA